MKTMHGWLAAMLAATLCGGAGRAQAPADYDGLKAQAEKAFAEKSYAQAHELYRQARALPLAADEARWVAFRLADTTWRAAAGTHQSDPSKFEQAERDLNVLVRDIVRPEDRDRVWAEVQESLGDFRWARRDSRDWGGGWQHYEPALEWWASSSDLATARGRYLAMVWRMAKPPFAESWYTYGGYGQIPLNVLENALKIAQGAEDQAHAHYLLAMTYRNRYGDMEDRKRAIEEFEAALKLGKKTDWFDDALYQFAEYIMNQGRAVQDKDGNWRQEPDYIRALTLFRQLVTEFKEGESRFFEQAKQQIKTITDPQVGVTAAHVFLPGSEIQYSFSWRNIKRADLALYRVDLTKLVRFDNREHGSHQWLEHVDLTLAEKLKDWSRETTDKGDYRPGNDQLTLDTKLEPGAYVVQALGGGTQAREIFLVSDAVLVFKQTGRQGLLWFCDALSGVPLAGAAVKVCERYYDGSQNVWREESLTTDTNGLANIKLSGRDNNSVEVFGAAALSNRQAFVVSSCWWGRNDIERWKIYAFTDRPAYRPGEEAQWKFTARTYDGRQYATPAGQKLQWQINDPRGAKVAEGTALLNDFGSAWGQLPVTEKVPLGEYKISFWDAGRSHQIGNATLFRLEEYKLPEFKVNVQVPEENGKKKTFRLGERITVTVQADYYFGGAVANASAELLVYQKPYYHYWMEPREFPWFYENDAALGRQRYGAYGPGQVIKRETLKLDALGKAQLTFDTPRERSQEFEYRIEARVTDASRREIVGNGTVRVTRQRYAVHPAPEHNLYRPQDKVRIKFSASDANDQPVTVEGAVKVWRDRWQEIWRMPDGREVFGDALRTERAKCLSFPPPPPRPTDPPWQCLHRGWQHDEVTARTIKTDAQGNAEFVFTPEREGYYRVTWRSPDAGGADVQAQTTVWIAQNATSDLGYRHGGLELIVDKDTVKPGQTVPVMLLAPTSDRYVLFSVEAEESISYQLVHLEGDVKLLELPLDERHVPNIFLDAALVTDLQLFNATKEIIVPPVRQFLTLELKADKAQYQPREEGTLTLTVRDHAGQPVSAEVALGLTDESVFYIQNDYAGDPRQFFYGSKRQRQARLDSTFQQKSYAKLVPEKDKPKPVSPVESEPELTQDASGLDMDGLQFTKSGRLTLNGAVTFGGVVTKASGASGAAFEADAVTAAAAATPMEMPMGRRMAGAKDERTAYKRKGGGGGGAGEAEPAIVVRSDFRSTVLWRPDLVTDKDGTAKVKVTFPDSLTSWRASARAASAGSQFGWSNITVQTHQPLICRLQAPRFFTVGDIVTISSVVNNNTDQALTVQPDLELGGVLAHVRLEPAAKLTVPPNGEARADWVINITEAGEAKLKVSARGGKLADAMEKTFTVYAHGIEKFLAKSGKLRGKEAVVTLDLPPRKPESTTLTVQVTPSMAVTMLDALPYLADYPYGCTEQTMSRFLPAVITAKTLKDLGLSADVVAGKLFGGIEKEFADKTHPKGPRDLAKLDAMVKAGLDRLYDFQHNDGGWGWWKIGDSDNYMTAYVVWGLVQARLAGIEVRAGVIERGAAYLDKKLVNEEENPDNQAWMLHALAAHYALAKPAAIEAFEDKAFANLWKQREALNAYTRSLFALAAHAYGRNNEAQTLIRNLENGVKRDARPDLSVLVDAGRDAGAGMLGTAHWGEDAIWWRWSEGGIEATAFALKALLAIDPKNALVEPVTNWLIKNRRGAQWSNTRDTAFVVLALNDYLRTSGELQAAGEYEITVNGKTVARQKVTPADVLAAPSRFAVERKLLRDGANEIRIVRRGGDAPLYFAAHAQFFSLEEPVAPAGTEIFVKRQYYKYSGRPTLLKGWVYDRAPVQDGDTVQSGDRVEVLLTIEGKNNYEYLVFEDLKPAGLEAVAVRSGEDLAARELKSAAVARKFGTVEKPAAAANTPYVVQSGDTLGGLARKYGTTSKAIMAANQLDSSKIGAGRKLLIPGLPPPPPPGADYTGRTRSVYQELRDRKVALFLDKLPEGVWQIRYDLRAEAPGTFHALPVLGHAMYVPEIRCNSAEIRMTVVDKPAADASPTESARK
jgi:hypothetical protein